MELINLQGYRWMMWLGLAVFVVEALVVVLLDELLALFVFLIIDSSVALVGMGMVKKGRRQETHNLEDDTKTLEMLRQAGFTTSESERLCLLRRRYMQQENEQACEDLSRLKFVRWLVTTGKLTDQL